MRGLLALLFMLLIPVLPVNAAGDPYLQRQGSWGYDRPDQWGLFAINAYQREPGSNAVVPLFDKGQLQPVVVAVIDTGVDYRHPELPTERFWRNPLEVVDGRDNDGNGYVDDLIGWNFVSHSNTPWDDHGHGTHVAGLIAAQSDNGRGIAGLAPNAQLMVLKALNSDGAGRGSDIADAIRYAVDQGAAIIHLSLGGEPPGELERLAVKRALTEGRLVVVAAGNRAQQIQQHGYEAMDGVLVVGGVNPDLKRAEFSDWGMRLDLVAPAVDQLSLRAFSTDFLLSDGERDYVPASATVGQGYYRASGNSFAAPWVTGAAALLAGLRPELGGEVLARVLRQSAHPLAPGGHNQRHGSGLLNVAAALTYPAHQYLLARFSGAEVSTDGALILHGQADADQFLDASLESGVGRQPVRWQPMLADVIRQRKTGPLAVLDTELLPDAEWVTFRLTVKRADGSQKQSLLQLNLGR